MCLNVGIGINLDYMYTSSTHSMRNLVRYPKSHRQAIQDITNIHVTVQCVLLLQHSTVLL